MPDPKSFLPRCTRLIAEADDAQLEGAVVDVLGLLASATRAERVHVLSLDTRARRVKVTHEYCAQDLPPMQDVTFEAAQFPYEWERLLSPREVLSLHPEETPDEAVPLALALEEEGVQSFGMFPILGEEDRPLGFLHLEWLCEPAPLDVDLGLVRNVASLLGKRRLTG